jgi:hypothetical protein
MTRNDTWTWTFTPRATEQFGEMDPHVQDRIVSKLDDVVDSKWREPAEFLEPLIGDHSRSYGSDNIVSPVSWTTKRRYSRSTESNIEVARITLMMIDCQHRSIRPLS